MFIFQNMNVMYPSDQEIKNIQTSQFKAFKKGDLPLFLQNHEAYTTQLIGFLTEHRNAYENKLAELNNDPKAGKKEKEDVESRLNLIDKAIESLKELNGRYEAIANMKQKDQYGNLVKYQPPKLQDIKKQKDQGDVKVYEDGTIADEDGQVREFSKYLAPTLEYFGLWSEPKSETFVDLGDVPKDPSMIQNWGICSINFGDPVYKTAGEEKTQFVPVAGSLLVCKDGWLIIKEGKITWTYGFIPTPNEEVFAGLSMLVVGGIFTVLDCMWIGKLFQGVRTSLTATAREIAYRKIAPKLVEKLGDKFVISEVADKTAQEMATMLIMAKADGTQFVKEVGKDGITRLLSAESKESIFRVVPNPTNNKLNQYILEGTDKVMFEEQVKQVDKKWVKVLVPTENWTDAAGENIVGEIILREQLVGGQKLINFQISFNLHDISANGVLNTVQKSIDNIVSVSQKEKITGTTIREEVTGVKGTLSFKGSIKLTEEKIAEQSLAKSKKYATEVVKDLKDWAFKEKDLNLTGNWFDDFAKWASEKYFGKAPIVWADLTESQVKAMANNYLLDRIAVGFSASISKLGASELKTMTSDKLNQLFQAYASTYFEDKAIRQLGLITLDEVGKDINRTAWQELIHKLRLESKEFYLKYADFYAQYKAVNYNPYYLVGKYTTKFFNLTNVYAFGFGKAGVFAVGQFMHGFFTPAQKFYMYTLPPRWINNIGYMNWYYPGVSDDQSFPGLVNSWGKENMVVLIKPTGITKTEQELSLADWWNVFADAEHYGSYAEIASLDMWLKSTNVKDAVSVQVQQKIRAKGNDWDAWLEATKIWNDYASKNDIKGLMEYLKIPVVTNNLVIDSSKIKSDAYKDGEVQQKVEYKFSTSDAGSSGEYFSKVFSNAKNYKGFIAALEGAASDWATTNIKTKEEASTQLKKEIEAVKIPNVYKDGNMYYIYVKGGKIVKDGEGGKLVKGADEIFLQFESLLFANKKNEIISTASPYFNDFKPR